MAHARTTRVANTVFYNKMPSIPQIHGIVTVLTNTNIPKGKSICHMLDKALNGEVNAFHQSEATISWQR
jgi:hypothetical protein